MDAGPKVATTLLLMLVSWSVHAVSGADRWQSLRENNPFVPFQPPALVVEPPPPNLELRGVLVEGRVTWFNVYNGETKESVWVKKGEQLTAFVVKDYDMVKDALTLASPQRTLSVALKQSTMKLLTGAGRIITGVASLGSPAPLPSTVAMASPLPTSETRRLEQLAVEIRERREQRKRMAAQTST